MEGGSEMSMTVRELKEILDVLPDSTSVCKTSGEDGCQSLDCVRYCPEYSILYLEPYYTDRFQKRDNLKLDDFSRLSKSDFRRNKETMNRIWRLAHDAKLIVDAKNDGKMHNIKVFVDRENPIWAQCACIDDKEWFGADCHNRLQTIIEFEWESLGLRLN